MLFRVSVVVLVTCIVLAAHRDGRRSPIVIGLVPWLLAMLLGPVLFRYNVEYSVKADVFVAVCSIAVTLGYLLVRDAPKTPPRNHRHSDLEVRIAQLLGVAGIVGCLLLLAEARTTGVPLSFSYLLANLGAVRDERFRGLTTSVAQSPAAVLGSYLAGCSFLTVVAATRLGKTGRIRELAIANLLLVGAVSLLVEAGRTTVVNIALLGAVGAVAVGRRLLPTRPHAIALTLLATIGVWYFAVPFLATRERGADPERVLAQTQRAELREWVGFARDNDSTGLALVSIGYFTSPVATLSFYLQRDVPGPLLGAYSYPLPARTIAKATGKNTPDLWLQNRLQVFAPIEQAGYFPNVWSTWLRDLRVDFGYAGTAIFLLAFGGFIAWARNRFESSGLLLYHYFGTLATLTFAFGAFQNLLWSNFLSNAFYLTLVLAVVIRLWPNTAVE